MSDRYYDRHDNSYDSYEDEYEDRYYGSRLSRSGYANGRAASRRFDDSGRASAPSGAARSQRGRSDYPAYGYDAGYRLSQSSDARYRTTSNLFEDYYSDEEVDAYRRFAYGTSHARRSASASGGDSRRERVRASRRASDELPAQRTPSRDFDSGDRPPTGSARRGASRTGASARLSNPEPSPKRSNRKRNIAIAAVVVVVLILMGVGMAFAYVNSISANLHEGVEDEVYEVLTPTTLDDEPFYMLLLGTDTSVHRALYEENGDTVRSDSMILARIDPVNKKVSLISIDRDTMVEIDGYGTQKINAAFELGGPAGAVKAVSKMSGLDIAHYASVDFDGFAAIVDALGGIEVDVPIAVDDPAAGGSVEAGLQTLNGEQALILCRSRHAYDDMDTVGGYIRDGYQRIVLGAIAKKVLSSDILTIASTVRDISRYVSTDLDISDIIGLAQIMQGLDPDTDVYTAREPTESLYVDETWYELLDEAEWAKMIGRMEKGLSPSDAVEVDQATGVVLSTTGSKSEASAAASAVSVGEGARAVNWRDPDDEEYWWDGGDGEYGDYENYGEYDGYGEYDEYGEYGEYDGYDGSFDEE